MKFNIKTEAFHTYNTEIAKELGAPAAFLVHHFIRWMMFNKSQNKCLVKNECRINYEHEGKIWTFSTIEDLHDFFPEFNEKTIRRALARLKEKKIIEIGNFNKYKFDKTNWYTIIDQSILDMYDIKWKKDKDKEPFEA